MFIDEVRKITRESKAAGHLEDVIRRIKNI